MRARYHPEKMASQIVFNSAETDQPFRSMSLETIPNKPHRQITGKDSFPTAPDESHFNPKRPVRDDPIDTPDLSDADADDAPAPQLSAHSEDSCAASHQPARRRGSRMNEPSDSPEHGPVAPFAREYFPGDQPAPRADRQTRDIMKVDDLEGAHAGPAVTRFRRRSNGDDESGNGILMIPSMMQQGKQLEREQAMRNVRGEQLRAYESRNVHIGFGSSDPEHDVPRKQRDPGMRHDTF
jgi:hypothetical protein